MSRDKPIGPQVCSVRVENSGIVKRLSSEFYAPTKLFVVLGWQGAFREEGTGI